MVASEGLWGLERPADFSCEAGCTDSPAELPRAYRTVVSWIWMDEPMKPLSNSTAKEDLPQIYSQVTSTAHESSAGVRIRDFG